MNGTKCGQRQINSANINRVDYLIVLPHITLLTVIRVSCQAGFKPDMVILSVSYGYFACDNDIPAWYQSGTPLNSQISGFRLKNLAHAADISYITPLDSLQE